MYTGFDEAGALDFAFDAGDSNTRHSIRSILKSLDK